MFRQIAFLWLVFFAGHNFSFSQTLRVGGIVLDSITKKAVPYATIVQKNSGNYLISADDGKFSIDAKVEDSIMISSVGYISNSILVTKLCSDRDTFFLKMNEKEMAEISFAVSRKMVHYAELGYHKYKPYSEYGIQPDVRIGVYIANPSKRIAILSEIIFLLKEKGKCGDDLLLKIFEADSNHIENSNRLIAAPIVVKRKDIRKRNRVNVESMKIPFSKTGVIVSIESAGIPKQGCWGESLAAIRVTKDYLNNAEVIEFGKEGMNRWGFVGYNPTGETRYTLNLGVSIKY